MAPLSTPLRITLLSASVGIALIGALAMYFQRRKKRPKVYRNISAYSKVSRMSRENSVDHIPGSGKDSSYSSLERRSRRLGTAKPVSNGGKCF